MTSRPLDDVGANDFNFDYAEWEPTKLQNGKSVFVKDGVVMLPSFHATPPYLPAPLSRPDEVRDFIAASIAQSNGVLIDFEVVEVAGCKLMRTVAKMRGSGRAMAYLGAIQLHSEPCWWLIQMEARETGTTGMREAVPSDDPQWDGLIPGHPLFAVRASQAQVLASAVISDRARALPPFVGAG